ncbi:putative methyltransferase PMT13 [Sesamum angolense]|uniref:Methyltransferase n=1 Tax=Sesamum angolense TaxID=2727404 RepID=A0AAE1T332_9LAMI|nr:putative methyltransferase PMT13 [Sesamum angolense]
MLELKCSFPRVEIFSLVFCNTLELTSSPLYGLINMPYNKIADRKGHQGWMKREGPHFIFPGGGTMFPDGAVQYIEKLKQYIPISGGTLRTALDMGCGVASFGGYMLGEGILTLSFAPRDSHKAQIQFALEGNTSIVCLAHLDFPSLVSFDALFSMFDSLHCIAVARSLCYELIVVDGNTVIWSLGPNQNEFGLDLCNESDDPSFAWYIKLKRTSSVEYAIGMIPGQRD